MDDLLQFYADVGTTAGTIGIIVGHSTFNPTNIVSKQFFLSGTTNIAPNTTYHKKQYWPEAVEEYQNVALFRRHNLPHPRKDFDLSDALEWFRGVMNINYSITSQFPKHPILTWIQSPTGEGRWYSPKEGPISVQFRKLSKTRKLELMKIEADPPGGVRESDPLLYMLFRIYGHEHASVGSHAHAIAIEEISKRTLQGSSYAVSRSDWQKYLAELKKAQH